MAEQVYLNGELVDAQSARISVFDAGLLHGAGLFEVLRCYGGRPYRLEDHLARMTDSGRSLGLVVRLTAPPAAEAVAGLLAANDLTDARVRITVTGGSVRVGIHQGAQANPNVLITAGPAQAPPDVLYADGVGVLLSDYRLSSHDPVARHKTLSYLPRLAALRAAQHARLAEAVMFSSEGYLASGATSNVFFVKDDILKTPSLDLPVLPGVTRKVVLEIARGLRIPVEEGKYTMDDMMGAEEMFLTGSTIELLPVVAVERHLVGGGRVGPLTRTVLQKYRQGIREELGLT